MNKLPSKLAKEPLIDVVFELRFVSPLPASNVLPGILIPQLGDTENIRMERQGAADIPAQMRAADPNLTYLPLISLFWQGFIIGISDRSVSISCTLPYPGWTSFYAAITKVLGAIQSTSYISMIERHSLKYVDLLEAGDMSAQVSALNLKLSLGGHELVDESFQVRMDIVEGRYTKIVQMISNAQFIRGEQKKGGVVVDVDIILPLNLPPADYYSQLNMLLNEIHGINKTTFFACLREETISSLEPSYAS